VHTAYKHYAFQPRYLVSSSLDSTVRDMLRLSPERLLAL
jgi:phenylalanine-4-hydroxylase